MQPSRQGCFVTTDARGVAPRGRDGGIVGARNGKRAGMATADSPQAAQKIKPIESPLKTNYAAISVTITISTDENGNQVRTYTNKQGQTVLKQVQLDDNISGAMVNWLETYYIYDPYGRLAYQLPPRAVKALGAAVTLNANNVPELIYKYTYDTRGRLTQQKVPGAAVKYFVYDKLNRLVLSQDGNQRAQNAWAFIKYDVYQRPVYSGIYTNTVQTDLRPQRQPVDPRPKAEPASPERHHGYQHGPTGG